jgi:hypothetical protein
MSSDILSDSADSDKNTRKLRIERGIQLPEKYKKNFDARNVEVLPFFQVVESLSIRSFPARQLYVKGIWQYIFYYFIVKNF